MIEAKKNVISELEKERISNYVRDMLPEELEFLVRLIDSEVMSNELARREKLKSVQIKAIQGILKTE